MLGLGLETTNNAYDRGVGVGGRRGRATYNLLSSDLLIVAPLDICCEQLLIFPISCVYSVSILWIWWHSLSYFESTVWYELAL